MAFLPNKKKRNNRRPPGSRKSEEPTVIELEGELSGELLVVLEDDASVGHDLLLLGALKSDVFVLHYIVMKYLLPGKELQDSLKRHWSDLLIRQAHLFSVIRHHGGGLAPSVITSGVEQLTASCPA